MLVMLLFLVFSDLICDKVIGEEKKIVWKLVFLDLLFKIYFTLPLFLLCKCYFYGLLDACYSTKFMQSFIHICV